MTDIILQLVGSVALVLFALMLYRIALGPDWFSRYGKEALICSATYTMTAVVMRMLALLGYITHQDARTINGLIAIGFLGIMVQITYLHWFTHRKDKGGAL